jgi:hypothetical protein
VQITSTRGGLRLQWERGESRVWSGPPLVAKPVTHEADEFLGKYPLSRRPPRAGGQVTYWAKGPFEFVLAREKDPWGEDSERSVTAPYWSVAVALGALPAFVPLVRRYRRRVRRRRDGLCLRCGYDLRATSGRCSECGTEVGAGTLVTR